MDVMTVNPVPAGVDVQKPLFKIFVGNNDDGDEGLAFTAYRKYIKKTSTIPVEVIPFSQYDLKKSSNEFSFTRLWKTNLAKFDGWAVFVGCEFLYFGDDINQVLNLVDDKYSMMCVNDCATMVLYNCAHPKNKQMLTPEDVDPETSVFLQRKYPSVPFVWKFLVDHNKTFSKAIRYTTLGPQLDIERFLSNRNFKVVSVLNPLPAKRRGQINLQAVLLTDDGSLQKFSPITLECPKVLLPLVNVPIIDYTLDWLESAGLEQVFVFCGNSWKELVDYLRSSGWFDKPKFTVTVIDSYNSSTAGDALRFLHKSNVIQKDFVLISGDTVSNMYLMKAILEHWDRRKKDSSAIFTMLVNQSNPSPLTHQSSLGTDEIYMAINPVTKELLYYKYNDSAKAECLVKELRDQYSSLSFYNDKEDCYVDICSPELLSFFANNSDYQHLRSHFVKRLLEDEIIGYKIFTHEIGSCYAARVDNFRSYDTISKFIMRNWRFPRAPYIGKWAWAIKLKRLETNWVSGETISHSETGLCSVIGKSSSIGNNTKVINSVIGEGCVIGDDVSIEDCYIWNNVTVEDGCKLQKALICDGVILKSRAVLNPGVVLSFNVLVGKDFVVPEYSKVSTRQPPIKRDSDEGLKCAERNIGTFGSSFTPTKEEDKLNREFASLFPRSLSHAASEDGAGGFGYIWPVCDDDWRYSVAPVPVSKLCELAKHPDFDVWNNEPIDESLDDPPYYE